LNIYCISGLGADWRVFQYLKLEHHRLIHLPWIAPNKNEPIKDYAERLMNDIDQSKPYSLLGMSFGGMVSIEIVKQIAVKPKVLFLVSSLAVSAELPYIIRVSRKMNLPRILPTKLWLWPNPISAYFFGTKTKTSRSLLGQILQDTDPTFLRWALKAIVDWQNTDDIEAVRIHGSDDKILPLSSNTNAYVIPDEGHFMVVNKADKVSEILLEALKAFPL